MEKFLYFVTTEALRFHNQIDITKAIQASWHVTISTCATVMKGASPGKAVDNPCTLSMLFGFLEKSKACFRRFMEGSSVRKRDISNQLFPIRGSIKASLWDCDVFRELAQRCGNIPFLELEAWYSVNYTVASKGHTLFSLFFFSLAT